MESGSFSGKCEERKKGARYKQESNRGNRRSEAARNSSSIRGDDKLKQWNCSSKLDELAN